MPVPVLLVAVVVVVVEVGVVVIAEQQLPGGLGTWRGWMLGNPATGHPLQVPKSCRNRSGGSGGVVAGVEALVPVLVPVPVVAGVEVKSGATAFWRCWHLERVAVNKSGYRPPSPGAKILPQ